MRKKTRPIWQLILGILSAVGLFYFIFHYSPSSPAEIANYNLPSLPLFFALLLLSITLLFGYIFKNLRRGLFLSLFIACYLILRLNNVTHVFFLILLVCLFVIIELFFKENNA